MITHELVNKKLDVMQLQSLDQDFLEGDKVTYFFRDVSVHVATIQPVLQPTGFILTGLPRHSFRFREKVNPKQNIESEQIKEA